VWHSAQPASPDWCRQNARRPQEGVGVMTLTAAIASDPPGSRRFRMVAPVVVLIGLLALILVPGLAA
jgi:hypothetical protein